MCVCACVSTQHWYHWKRNTPHCASIARFRSYPNTVLIESEENKPDVFFTSINKIRIPLLSVSLSLCVCVCVRVSLNFRYVSVCHLFSLFFYLYISLFLSFFFVCSFSLSYSFYLSGFSSVAWDSYGGWVSSPHCFLFASGGSSTTKFEPLPSKEPAIRCYSNCGVVFGSSYNGEYYWDVLHDSKSVSVRDSGPNAGFNISSIVPYDWSGKYTLEEMEVFTVQYE